MSPSVDQPALTISSQLLLQPTCSVLFSSPVRQQAALVGLHV